MDLSFFPERYVGILNKVNLIELYEIRLRIGYPVLLKFPNKTLYLGDCGETLLEENALICVQNDINDIINNVTEHSLYAFNDMIKNGYLSTNQGVRIGLAGECVFENGKIITIKNFSSLNIRIPHEIRNCSENFYNKIYNKKDNYLFNTLIISAPLYGKTTVLKDLARKIDKEDYGSILIIDERDEFVNVKGKNIDSIKYSDKLYAFEFSLRSMAPRVVITDELTTENDWQCVFNASNSGTAILASCHARTIEDVICKKYFKKGVFERYVLLKSSGNAGVLDCVYDGEFNII